MPIETLLPESGTGFLCNNRASNTHYGEQATIDAVIRAGKAWAEIHSSPFSVGQISRKGGGIFPPHKSHKLGIDVDVRPLRRDGKNESVTINDDQYDQPGTISLLRLFRQVAPVHQIFFNDREAIAEGLSQFVNGHNNHFHVRLHMVGARPTLKFGSTGSAVRELQAKLGVDIDGNFGIQVQKALKAFQTAQGLKADGICGPTSWKALGA